MSSLLRHSKFITPDPSVTNPQFVKNTDEFENCTACNRMLWNAFMLPCGHRVCPNGLDRVRQNGRCMVEDCGTEYSDEENHQSSCEYRIASCEQCRKSIRASLLQKHLDEECEQRMCPCPKQCGTSTEAINMQNHLAHECSNAILDCPNQCGITSMSREELHNHNNECPLRKQSCRFKSMGCRFEGRGHEVEQHTQEGLLYHVELLLTTHADTGNEEEIDKLKETIQKMLKESENIPKLQDENSRLRKENQTNKKAIQDMKKVLVSQGEKVINVERQLDSRVSNDSVETIKRDVTVVSQTVQAAKQRIETLERTIGTAGQTGGTNVQVVERVEKHVGLLDVRMCEMDLRLQLLETINQEGVLMWKIRDYSRRKTEAVNGKTLSLYSQPFYTSQYGYKLCGRVYLNGDGTGKGTYLSFFVVVMKGDFDALLQWPFTLPVTLMLLDQNGTGNHVRTTFTPNPASNSFRRPTTDLNVACGVPCFLQHTKLETDTYVKDDTIFLRAVVDCSKENPMF
ncbi:TNF receptor-associated factor 3-like isoform X3 [Argopecten irradians]|uniref:TNF receptor-associated factor 3-like isoform X3 n=1 Tax=Argopecten irradians TaxID=31199 RepID=UPI003719D7AC